MDAIIKSSADLFYASNTDRTSAPMVSTLKPPTLSNAVARLVKGHSFNPNIKYEMP
jgi:hypothetical protein